MMTSLERDDRLGAATQTAMRLLEEGSPQDANETLVRALRDGEGDHVAWVVLARTQQRLSDFAGMVESAVAARRLAPEEGTAHPRREADGGAPRRA